MLELTARTEAGARLVALAETLALQLARRAPGEDGIEILRRAGYLTAPVPRVHGGMGVASVHDTIVASSRIARGDASLAIVANVHMVVLLSIARRWRAALDGGDVRRAAGLGTFMEDVVRDGVLITTSIRSPLSA